MCLVCDRTGSLCPCWELGMQVEGQGTGSRMEVFRDSESVEVLEGRAAHLDFSRS